MINELMIFSYCKRILHRDCRGVSWGSLFSYVITDVVCASSESLVFMSSYKSSYCTCFSIYRAGDGAGSIGATSLSTCSLDYTSL